MNAAASDSDLLASTPAAPAPDLAPRAAGGPGPGQRQHRAAAPASGQHHWFGFDRWLTTAGDQEFVLA